MAHIFKYPTESAKGIVVFTHKEWPWLLQNALPTIQNLRQYFYLGWNQGTYFGNIGGMPKEVDFVFTSKNTMSFPDNGHTLTFELLDRNFLLDAYKDLNISERYYDIISTSRAAKIKHLPALLLALRKLYDKGKKYKVLIVVPKAENESASKFDIDIVEQYKTLFNYEERQSISLIRVSSEMGFLGISPDTINWFYNNSKVLYIGTKAEGGCRVVHESLMCGCNVIYYKNHTGGMLDYLDNSNSIAYDSYETIAETLEQAVDNFKYNPAKSAYYEELLSERFASDKLIPYFNNLYDRDGVIFDGKLINIDNLSNRLPAHYLDVPWNVVEEPTADIKTSNQLKVFIEYINSQASNES